MGALVGSFHLFLVAHPVAYLRYLVSLVSRKASMSPLMNSELNHVESPGLACPESRLLLYPRAVAGRGSTRPRSKR